MKKRLILFIGALLLIVCIGFSYTNKSVVEGLTPAIGCPPGWTAGGQAPQGVGGRKGNAWYHSDTGKCDINYCYFQDGGDAWCETVDGAMISSKDAAYVNLLAAEKARAAAVAAAAAVPDGYVMPLPGGGTWEGARADVNGVAGQCELGSVFTKNVGQSRGAFTGCPNGDWCCKRTAAAAAAAADTWEGASADVNGVAGQCELGSVFTRADSSNNAFPGCPPTDWCCKRTAAAAAAAADTWEGASADVNGVAGQCELGSVFTRADSSNNAFPGCPPNDWCCKRKVPPANTSTTNAPTNAPTAGPSNASICAAAFNECQTLSSAAGGGSSTTAASSTTTQPTQPPPTQPQPTHSRTPNPDVAANASEISTLKNELQTLQQQENQLEIDMGAGSGPINHTGARYSSNPKGSGTINFKCING